MQAGGVEMKREGLAKSCLRRSESPYSRQLLCGGNVTEVRGQPSRVNPSPARCCP